MKQLFHKSKFNWKWHVLGLYSSNNYSRFYSSTIIPTNLPKEWSVLEQVPTMDKHSLSKNVTKAPIHVLKHIPSDAQFVHVQTCDDSFGYVSSVIVDHSLNRIQNAWLPLAAQFMLLSKVYNSFSSTYLTNFSLETKCGKYFKSLSHIKQWFIDSHYL